MMVLFHLHNPNVEAFVHTCDLCKKEIDGDRYTCTTCQSFDLCEVCTLIFYLPLVRMTPYRTHLVAKQQKHNHNMQPCYSLNGPSSHPHPLRSSKVGFYFASFETSLGLTIVQKKHVHFSKTKLRKTLRCSPCWTTQASAVSRTAKYPIARG